MPAWKENAGKLYPSKLPMEPLTKQGQHGTLYQYAITWDDRDPMRGDETSKVWAYSAEHAEEKFLESSVDEGYPDIRIKKVQRVMVPKGSGGARGTSGTGGTSFTEGLMLNRGCSKAARSKNIGRLLREGKPIRQAVAIASKVQREHCACRTSRGPRGGRTMTCHPKKRRRA